MLDICQKCIFYALFYFLFYKYLYYPEENLKCPRSLAEEPFICFPLQHFLYNTFSFIIFIVFGSMIKARVTNVGVNK